MSDEQRSRPWLQEKVYDVKKAHTICLVQQAVDDLVEQHKQNPHVRISVATVLARTKGIDPEHVGVSETGLRENDAAWAYFCQHRTWKPLASKRVTARLDGTDREGHPVKLDRDLEAVRRRYWGLSKAELVERLIAVEQAYAEREEHWLRLNDQLVIWRQRAELAEQRVSAQRQG